MRVSGFFFGFFFGFATGLGAGLDAGGSGFLTPARFFGLLACRCRARGSISTRFGGAAFGFGAGSAFFAGFGGVGGAASGLALAVVFGGSGFGGAFGLAAAVFSGGFGFGCAFGFATLGGSISAGFGFGAAVLGKSGFADFGLTGSGFSGGFPARRSRATGFLVVSRSASGLRSVLGFGFSPLPACVMSDRRTISTSKLRAAFAGGFASQGTPSAAASRTSVCRATEMRMPRMAARLPSSRCRLRRSARPSGSRRSKSNS